MELQCRGVVAALLRRSKMLQLRLTSPRIVLCLSVVFFFFQAEDGIRDVAVTGVQTCALPISYKHSTAVFLHLTGRIPTSLTHPKNAKRPEWEAEILRDCARRVGAKANPQTSGAVHL